MKAIVYTRYGPPDVLELKEVAKPSPKDNEVLVKVRATTVTAGDIRARGFTVPRSVWLPARVALGVRRPRKRILGLELAGEIEAVGRDVSRFRTGDHVMAATLVGFGAYAEYRCLPEDAAVGPKPSNTTFEEAAALPIGARTALHFLRKADVRSGQHVLVYGASGSVGTYAVQLAKHLGAEVTGVCSSGNVPMVKALGADKVIDYTREDFAAAGPQYDVVFEAVNKSSFSACIAALKATGTYVNVTEPVPSLRILWTRLTTDKKIILAGNVPDRREDLVFLGKLVEEGALRPVVDRCYPLERIAEAHRYVEAGHKKGNVAITVAHGHARP